MSYKHILVANLYGMCAAYLAHLEKSPGLEMIACCWQLVLNIVLPVDGTLLSNMSELLCNTLIHSILRICLLQ